MHKTWHYIGAITLCLLTSCSYTPLSQKSASTIVMLLPATSNAFSISEEQDLGKEHLAKMHEDGVIFIEQLDIDHYLTSVVDRLMACLPIEYPHFAIHILVVRNSPDSSMLGLMSFAGGYLLVPLTQVAETPSEDILATEIAHEIGHIELRQSTRWETAQRALHEYLLSTFGELVESDPSLSGLRTDMQTYLSMIDVGFEDDADLFAVRMAIRGGYDARAYARWLSEHYSFPVSLTFLNGHRSGNLRAEAMQSEWDRVSNLHELHCAHPRTSSFSQAQHSAKKLLSE